MDYKMMVLRVIYMWMQLALHKSMYMSLRSIENGVHDASAMRRKKKKGTLIQVFFIIINS